MIIIIHNLLEQVLKFDLYKKVYKPQKQYNNIEIFYILYVRPRHNWRPRFLLKSRQSLPTAAVTLSNCNSDLFLSIYFLLKERTFSTQKWVKIYFRNATGENRLNDLVLLKVDPENEINMFFKT